MHNTQINQIKRAKRGGQSSCLDDSSVFISSVSALCLSLQLALTDSRTFFTTTV